MTERKRGGKNASVVARAIRAKGGQAGREEGEVAGRSTRPNSTHQDPHVLESFPLLGNTIIQVEIKIVKLGVERVLGILVKVVVAVSGLLDERRQEARESV